MNSLALEVFVPEILSARVSEEALTVDLSDGRSLAVPLAWFPRLSNASSQERANWRLIGNGRGLHWPDLNEDISIESLIAGRASAETQQSLGKWLEERRSVLRAR